MTEFIPKLHLRTAYRQTIERGILRTSAAKFKLA